jgi:hypothetical protein
MSYASSGHITKLKQSIVAPSDIYGQYSKNCLHSLNSTVPLYKCRVIWGIEVLNHFWARLFVFVRVVTKFLLAGFKIDILTFSKYPPLVKKKLSRSSLQMSLLKRPCPKGVVPFHRSAFSSKRLFIEMPFHRNAFSSKRLFIETPFHRTYLGVPFHWTCIRCAHSPNEVTINSFIFYEKAPSGFSPRVKSKIFIWNIFSTLQGAGACNIKLFTAVIYGFE